MAFIKRLFWNDEQRRLHALWRIAITMIAFAAPVLVFGIALGMILLLPTGSPDEVSRLLSSGPMQALVLAAITASLLLATWISARWIDRRRWADYGFRFNRRWWGDFGFGLALGAALMGLIFAVEAAAGWVQASVVFAERGAGTFALDFLLATLLFTGVGIYEELLYRGVLIKNMAEGARAANPRPRRTLIIAYVVSSALFGLAHAGNAHATWISTANIALAGLALGLPYLLTGELAASIGLHITWNLFQGNVFGFPVSGGTFAPPTLIAIQQHGPEAWTGGAFGPEGGLIGVAALAVGAGLTLLWARWRNGQIALSAALPQYAAREPKRGEAIS